MKEFVQYMPTKVVFGRDTEKETGRLVKESGASRVLVIYGGGSAVRSGLLFRVEESLKEYGIVYEELSGVKPNPGLSLAREGVKKASSFGADLILAVGGGSVIDTAKAAALGAANPGTDIWEFWMGRAQTVKALPVGVVLTIPAAGSEMSEVLIRQY